MADGWVEIRKGQAYLHGIQINEYAQANRWGHEVARVRKLLMHKHEIDKLGTKTLIKGFTLIPLVDLLQGQQGQGRARASSPTRSSTTSASRSGKPMTSARSIAR